MLETLKFLQVTSDRLLEDNERIMGFNYFFYYGIKKNTIQFAHHWVLFSVIFFKAISSNLQRKEDKGLWMPKILRAVSRITTDVNL